MPVEAKLLEIGHVLQQAVRDLPRQNFDCEQGKCQTEAASRYGEQKAFYGELTQEPGAGGTQCGTNSDLAPAAFGSDEQKTGDVDEADQQQQSGSAEERDE